MQSPLPGEGCCSPIPHALPSISLCLPRRTRSCSTTSPAHLNASLLPLFLSSLALQNKVIFNYFPYPWFVSTVHVVVGALYCIVAYLLGAKKASFERVRVEAGQGSAGGAVTGRGGEGEGFCCRPGRG